MSLRRGPLILLPLLLVLEPRLPVPRRQIQRQEQLEDQPEDQPEDPHRRPQQPQHQAQRGIFRRGISIRRVRSIWQLLRGKLRISSIWRLLCIDLLPVRWRGIYYNFKLACNGINRIRRESEGQPCMVAFRCFCRTIPLVTKFMTWI